MKQVPPWLKPFKISEDDYREWLGRFPSEDHLLSWGIETKRLDEQKYLKWAKAFYELPVLKEQFFDAPIPSDLWSKYIKEPWGPSLLPLSEWDGTLYIGCLEPPPPELFKHLKAQYFLAS